MRGMEVSGRNGMIGFVNGTFGGCVNRCGRGLTASDWVQRGPRALRRAKRGEHAPTVRQRLGAGQAQAMMTSNVGTAFLLSTLAGLSTGIGGVLMVLQKDLTYKKLGYWQGAAGGFMMCVSFIDLLPEVFAVGVPYAQSALLFALGIGLVAALKVFVPEPEMADMNVEGDEGLRAVLMSGILTAFGIGIHNFPEGIAVFISTLQGINVGLPLAIAIGLHNIPEGMAVALPIYFATRDKWRAVGWSLVSGIAEPLGVLIVILFSRDVLSDDVVGLMLSTVAGIMVALSVMELIPQSVEHSGWRGATFSTVGGFAAMTALLKGFESIGLKV